MRRADGLSSDHVRKGSNYQAHTRTHTHIHTHALAHAPTRSHTHTHVHAPTNLVWAQVTSGSVCVKFLCQSFLLIVSMVKGKGNENYDISSPLYFALCVLFVHFFFVLFSNKRDLKVAKHRSLDISSVNPY